MRTPMSPSFTASSGSSAAVFRSVATTVRPSPARKRAAAIPDRASPTTTTGFPAPARPMESANSLSQLQRGERQQREDEGDDPEPHHDLGFLPARELEVMV